MNKKITGGNSGMPGRINPQDIADAQQRREQGALQNDAPKPVLQKDIDAAMAARAQEARLREQDLPEHIPGLSAEPSQLQNVIQAGLSSLAKAHNWEATDNALGVLVKAMVGAGAASKTGDSAIPASLSMDFQRLLRAHVAPGDATALRQLKKDAQQLVQLATVALGMEGLEGLPKAKQEAQLEADVRAVHGALSDVLQLPAEQRGRLLDTTNELVQWKATVLDRSAKALDAAGVNTRSRLDALAGILRLVAGYAGNNAN